MAPKKNAKINATLFKKSQNVDIMYQSNVNILDLTHYDSKMSKVAIDDNSMTIEKLITENCFKLDCETDIFCNKQYQKELSKMKMPRKRNASGTLSAQSTTVNPITPENDQLNSQSSPVFIADDTIVIDTIYDSSERLVEIAFRKLEYIPRELMSVLTVLAPLQNSLTRLTFYRTKIHLQILRDLKKLLSVSQITDVIFDRCVVQKDCSYAVLLCPEIKLKCLSVANCGITDRIVKEIAEKLKYTEPAEQTLGVLNLSTNIITDEGAKYLGECLRSNRHLRHLNLAGNRITDVGAGYIFNSLGEFCLTPQELYETRLRKFEYLKRKFDIEGAALRKTKHDNKLKTSSATVLSFKKEKKVRRTSTSLMGLNTCLIEDFNDPFDKRRIIDGVVHNPGNFTMCYLNLMYNNLTYLSLIKLVNVLQYQSQNTMPSETGLIKIVIDGNYLPEYCDEYNIINDLIYKNISRCSGKELKSRRKSVY